jgi:V/A-type H+-transporting ATPase subunit K
MSTVLIAAAALSIPVGLTVAIWAARCRSASVERLRHALLGQLVLFGMTYLTLLLSSINTTLADEPLPPNAPATTRDPAPGSSQLSVGDGLALIGVALATGLSVLGAGYAVAVVGAAALGAIAEKPELFGRTLVFIGLAEGLAIYGLILSILILGRLG